MTIWLASCGQVATDQCEGQVPDRVLGAASIYQALVTWLLSLVSAVSWHKNLWVMRAVFGPPVNTQSLLKAPFLTPPTATKQWLNKVGIMF